MQTVAAIWLILTLTGSGVAVGLTTALQFLPMLLFGAWGGLLADRIPKRRLLIVDPGADGDPGHRPLRRHRDRRRRALDGLPAPSSRWGSVNAVDNPTRQSFVIEMVGPDRVVNAVSLNSVIVQSARIVGPALAGILIAGFGVVPCFAAQRAHLRRDDRRPLGDGPAQLCTPSRSRRARAGAIRAGLRYVRAHAGAGGAAGADGAGRHARLQLPGGAAAARQVQLRRRRHRPTRRWSRRWRSARSSAPWSTAPTGAPARA